MVTPKFTAEKLIRVFDNSTGEFIEVKIDDLGLLVIQQEKTQVVMPAEQAKLVRAAMEEIEAYIQANPE